MKYKFPNHTNATIRSGNVFIQIENSIAEIDPNNKEQVSLALQFEAVPVLKKKKEGK